MLFSHSFHFSISRHRHVEKSRKPRAVSKFFGARSDITIGLTRGSRECGTSR